MLTLRMYKEKSSLIMVIIISCCFVNGMKQCGPLFRGKCTCDYQDYENRKQYVVNCTDSGFYNTDVLTNLPLETEVLIFTGNHVSEVPWNIFGSLNDLENLRVVDMSNNEIREIRGKTYHHVKNVERLILNHNELVISSDIDNEENLHHPRVFSNFVNLLELHLTNAFKDYTDTTLSDDLHDIFIYSNLSRLMKLHLEQNEIYYFKDKQIFCDLPNLRDIYLGDNKLKNLNFNISCLKHLRFLDLEANNIEVFSKRELQMLDKINNNSNREERLYVDFRSNPLKCDCSARDLFTWLNKTNVTVRGNETLRCTRPKRMQGVLFSKLNTLKCLTDNKKKVVSAAHAGAYIFLIVAVTISIWLAVKLYSKRRFYVGFFSNKVLYTTIKDECVAEIL